MPLTHETETLHEVQVPLYSLLVEKSGAGFTLSFQSDPLHDFFKRLSGGKTEQIAVWGLECFQLSVGKIPQVGDVNFLAPNSERILEDGRLNAAFFRATSLAKGVKFSDAKQHLPSNAYGDMIGHLVRRTVEELYKQYLAPYQVRTKLTASEIRIA